MKVRTEKNGKNLVKLIVEIDAESFKAACSEIEGDDQDKIRKEAADKVVNNTFYQACDQAGIVAVDNKGIDVSISPDGVMVYTADLVIEPEVRLGQYKGIKVKNVEWSVSDDMVEKEIQEEQKRNVTWKQVKDRAVKNGDSINLDFSGSVDGVKFDGGSAEGYDLVIGSHSFIPGFEEQLLGAMPGQQVDVVVSFPENYPAAHLAGKESVFECLINFINEEILPELNDEFAKKVSGCENVEDYRQMVRANLEKQQSDQARSAMMEEALAQIIKDSEVDLPEAMVEGEIAYRFQEFENGIRSQGYTLGQYEQITGNSAEKLKNEMLRPAAVEGLKNKLVLEAIARAESIKVTEADVDKEVEEIANALSLPLDQAKNFFGNSGMLKDIENDLLKERAAAVIFDHLIRE